MQTKAVNNRQFYLCILFSILILINFFYYFISSNWIPWGHADGDDLYFMGLYVFVLPVMLLISFLKSRLFKHKGFVRFSYFRYTIAAIIPGYAYGNTSFGINMGIIVCIFVLAAVIFESIRYPATKNGH